MSRAAEAKEDGDSPLADPALRLAATLIDGLAPLAPFFFMLPVGVAIGSADLIHAGIAASLVCTLAIVGLNLFWLHRYGQTLGKRLLGLRILRSSGERATLGRLVLLRIAAPGLLGAIPIVGGLFQFVDPLLIFTSERQTLHDRIADTIVVDLRRGGPPVKPVEF